MGPHDLQRPAFTFGREAEVLATRADQPVPLQATRKRHQASIRQLQGAGERLERRAAALMLEPEKMLEGIFCELPLTTCATPTPQRQHPNAHTHVFLR
jgi:hypothetical protein